MTKDWEEEFIYDIDLLLNAVVYDVTEKGVTMTGIYRKNRPIIKDIIAKQRTKILARVREEVIGPPLIVYDKGESTGLSTRFMDGVNQLKKEQLKKLEIISEEGK